MADTKFRGYARVEVTVEVIVGAWEKSCTVEQIQKEASREAIEKLEHACNRHGSQFRIYRSPKVVAVLCPDTPESAKMPEHKSPLRKGLLAQARDLLGLGVEAVAKFDRLGKGATNG